MLNHALLIVHLFLFFVNSGESLAENLSLNYVDTVQKMVCDCKVQLRVIITESALSDLQCTPHLFFRNF
jgi:hypothetical protein